LSAARAWPAVVAGVALLAVAVACDGGAGSVAVSDAGAATSAAALHAIECATCHMPEYQSAHPVHVGVNPTTCGVCHTEQGWHPSRLEHPFWALTGAHEKAQCFYCHQGTPTRFAGTPKDCMACHRPEYESSTYPGHATFPTTCADCHTTKAFKPATKIPPAAPVIVTPPPSASASAGAKTLKTPKTPPVPTVRPTTVPTAPRVPTSVPTSRPPDVITRPSARR
jgi:hypothetical protein